MVKANRPPVVFIMGPTASGKTDLALALAAQMPAEIISVDSTLVYRGLDIGSAKPSAAELARVPHHLINIRDPAEPYSAGDFRTDAIHAIQTIHANGKVPLLVGGTMLYFNLLLNGLADMPASDLQVRERIENEALNKGWPHLHQQLQKIDPVMAAELHPNHSQRIARALEVYEVSGKTMTELRQAQEKSTEQSFVNQFDVKQIALAPHDRAILHHRIALRFERMLQNGFIAEVEQLFTRGDLSDSLPAVRAVGYRQMWMYLEGLINREEMREKGIAATRQLAKRQLTWLRGWPDLYWVYTDEENGTERNFTEIVKEALNYLQLTAI